MIESVPFQTRARTIDHLGREQIADCPTAVSELWKNAYDAYATKVELNIFDGELPVAAITDNGHGMSYDEIVGKWLIVGTESKFSNPLVIAEANQNGIPVRQRQGQKGIGRLSSANLGSLLLLVAKRQDSDFSAALVDWRIFENPYLMLQDIRIPTIRFSQKHELLESLQDMFIRLLSNIAPDPSDENGERDQRITYAWELLEAHEAQNKISSTKKSIEQTVISACFSERHFTVWDVWEGRADSGTAMFIANISDDLIAQLSQESRDLQDEVTRRSQERLFQTLSNFVDPYMRSHESTIYTNFETTVIAWNGLLRRAIIDEDRRFRVENLDDLEHVVEGTVDDQGTFRGSIKVFGKLLPEEIVISPKIKTKARSDGACGSFHIRVGGFEKDFKKTSLTRDKYDFFIAQSELYAGFMVHRDGLRVMPYGREDNDYFEIEKRRSSHAGRNFWSNRNIFGRVAISRAQNPNLKDKAGREGIIDNTASKRFRAFVENVLVEVAKKYIGTDSETRKAVVPDIQAKRAQERAETDKKKLATQQRKIFRTKLKNNTAPLTEFLETIERLTEEISQAQLANLEVLRPLKDKVVILSDQARDFSLSPVPNSLGSLEENYKEYRKVERRSAALLADASASINIALDKIKPKSANEIIKNGIQRAAAQLHARIRKHAAEGKELLSNESRRFNELIDECNKAFHQATSDIGNGVEAENIDLASALNLIDETQQKQHYENEERFQAYLSAMKNLRDQIDLENLVNHSLKDSAKLQNEIDRLHGLAQLGITVEIIGHELEALDLTMSRGLREFPSEVKESKAYKSVMAAQQGLSDRWRFLSPLKLSGEKYFSNISGAMIHHYILDFFSDSLKRSKVEMKATKAFLDFSIYDQTSRIYPVFVNLVNNSRYWLEQTENSHKKIVLDYIDGHVVVADNGPGVSPDDVEELFTLFFTRKARGGRGVGLYLCRTNLMAASHSIYYETTEKKKILSGANFKIGFKGANNE